VSAQVFHSDERLYTLVLVDPGTLLDGVTIPLWRLT
jgi:hypothetical protein